MAKPYFDMPEVYPRDEVDDLILALEKRIRELEEKVEDLKYEVLIASERNN